jgi:PEP-CTERM motif
MKNLFILTSLALLALAGNASAQIIKDIGILGPYSGTTPAPGSTTDYDFFQGSTAYSTNPTVSNPENLTNFTVTADSPFYTNSTQNATAPGGGTSFQVADAFANSPELTFALTNASETSFTVYINVSSGVGNSATLSETTGSGATATQDASTSSNGSGATSENYYAEFTVTGATTSDRFSVDGSNIEGITFAAGLPTTPEPATYALLGLGVLALIFVSRRASLRA